MEMLATFESGAWPTGHTFDPQTHDIHAQWSRPLYTHTEEHYFHYPNPTRDVVKEECEYNDYHDQVDVDYAEESSDGEMSYEDSAGSLAYDTISHPQVYDESQEYTLERFGQHPAPVAPYPSEYVPQPCQSEATMEPVQSGAVWDPEVVQLLQNVKPAVPFGPQYLFPWSGRVVCRAHQAIPPAFQSRYSEFTPHLEFMKKMQEDKESAARMGADDASSAASPSSTADSNHSVGSIPSQASPPSGSQASQTSAPPPPRQVRQPQRPILPSPARPKLKKASNLVPTAASASASARVRPKPTTALFIRTDPATGKIIGSRARESTKKPSLACKFCKERKIACGRPPEDAEDQTCNQCARRQIKCEYRPTDASRKRSSAQPK